MGSSSSKDLAGSGATTYTHYTQYTGNKKGTLGVRSCRVKSALGLGVHHGLVLDIPSADKYIVHEWSKEGRSSYAVKSLSGYWCIKNLGQHTADEVYEAASLYDPSTYGSNFNCNHWTESVAKELGHKITVHWNCSCVL